MSEKNQKGEILLRIQDIRTSRFNFRNIKNIVSNLRIRY